ncbi:MAG: hypothetical protein HY296_01970 [Thaumarchaeota archaeon]|nr:hypothetical protein [Nitrososphaerota archaeon]
MLTMVLELATVLLGACVGAVAVLYAAPRGYLGHPRRKASSAAVASLKTYTTATEQAKNTPTVDVPVAVVPAPSSAPPMYETVQPAPAPVTYTPPTSSSFGAPSIAKKPTRNYRRRSAPARSTTVSKATRTTKTKKR